MNNIEIQDKDPSGSQSDSAGINFVGMRMGVNISDANMTLLDKITPEHIDKMIDASKEDDQSRRKIQSRRQWMNLIYVILAIVAFVFIVIFLRSESDLLIRVITIAASFLGGLGTGFTLSKRKNGD
jgi:uncharacterized protein YneF (UPF0154 family)